MTIALRQAEQVADTGRPSSVATIVADIGRLARVVDDEGVYPEEALRALGAAGAYRHHIGGRAAGGGLTAAIDVMAEAGAACLSTAFCMWCQDALAWYLDRTANATLKARLLAPVSFGAQLGGTGLSNPMKAFAGIEPLALQGRRVDGGYRLSGRLPWVSNLGPDHLFASVFALEDGRRVMATFDCADPGLKLARNAHFVALEGTRTFTVLIRDLFVPDAAILAEDAAAFVPQIRQGFVLLQLGMALGLAEGAAQSMEQDDGARRAAAHLPLGPDRIRERAEALRVRATGRADEADDPSRGAFLETLKVRLDASWLALEATQSAVLQAGARGYLKGSDVARRQREAQFVAIVTPSIKHILRELAAG